MTGALNPPLFSPAAPIAGLLNLDKKTHNNHQTTSNMRIQQQNNPHKIKKTIPNK
jgi:hypothetical protein